MVRVRLGVCVGPTEVAVIVAVSDDKAVLVGVADGPTGVAV
jgi:hypothetical protein